jgi:hypothetical protein
MFFVLSFERQKKERKKRRPKIQMKEVVSHGPTPHLVQLPSFRTFLGIATALNDFEFDSPMADESPKCSAALNFL